MSIAPVPATWFLPRVAMISTSVLAIIVACADFCAPANYVVAIAYAVPLPLTAWTRSQKYLWILTALMIAATLGDLEFGMAPSFPQAMPITIANRIFVILMLLAVAGGVSVRIIMFEANAAQERSLTEQAAQLEVVNDELRQREEEIVRQNEELVSQTEELERQAEELRVTNEELAFRERSLEQLLELSRSMTADLSRSELLDKICEALGVLTQGNASAILERSGNEIEVVCHHGFGHDDVRRKQLPLMQSFASIIMSMGQTGYLEDIRTRPELALPEPAEGEPFLSVLSTPIRIQGKAIGTLDIYSPQPRTWDLSQVSLLESLAAQLSISLQNVELVESIKQERRRFETAFRTVPFGMIVTDDAEGKDIKINPAGASLLGVPSGENISAATAIGVRLRRLITRQNAPVDSHELPLSRALRGEEVLQEFLEYASPRGILSLMFCAAPIYNLESELVGAVAAFADVTELKVMQRELEIRRREAEEASQRKTRFLAAVSHDIRTPANAINLMAELIRRSSSNPELIKDMPDLAARLQANTVALMDLVSDVLDVARFDSGKIEITESEFLLGDLIHDECRQVKPLADDIGLNLIFEPLTRPIWLRTDRVKLGRVIGNLVGNSIKFTKTGTIRITAQFMPYEQGGVLIEVSDTGIGIAPENLLRIFDEFAQLHNPERDRNKGTGLGLAICKRLIDVLGGEITVESESGKGSVFRVKLPASCIAVRLDATYEPAKIADSRSQVFDASRMRLAGMHILIVEDHHTTREGTAQLLRQEGAKVTDVRDGSAAIAALRADHCEVLLLDMMLPDMDGREILRQLQAERHKNLKGVLVLTGDLTSDRMDEINRFGADGLIGKPIEIEKLIAKLETYRK